MRIFLSCVSGQFRACRDALASDLRAVGAEVVVQEDFQMHGRSLLEKLENYIASCDRVIALVGNAYGWEPDPEDGQALDLRLSYTQWEHRFAGGYRLNGPPVAPKPLYVYFASDEYLAVHPVDQKPEQAALQEIFSDRPRKSGKDQNQFSTRDELRALVLRDGFRMQNAERIPQNLPFPTLGRLFKGRDTFLERLRQTLLPPGAGAAAEGSPAIPVLDGLGGIGKTRLAVEFAWRNREAFSALLFVAADTPSNLRSNLAALTGPLVLNLDQQAEDREEVKIGAVCRWLSAHPGWFLIVDNVDTEAAAEEVVNLITTLQGGRVLITSRIRNWRAGVECLDLDVLSDADSREFLLERTENGRARRPNDREEAEALARELDGLALALEQAGAYICKRVMSIADYRQKLHRTASPLLRWHDRQTMEYPRSVAITWQASLEQVSEDARRLMRLLSWFSPEPFPLRTLEFDPLLADSRLDALAELETYSLVRRKGDGNSLTIHRLVQQITREDQSSPAGSREAANLPAALGEALQVLALTCAEDPKEAGAWAVWSDHEAHVAAAVGFALSWGGPEPTARLARGMGRFLDVKATYAEAERFMLLAQQLDAAGGADRVADLASDWNFLSDVHRHLGRYADAEAEARRALAMDEERTPQDPRAISRDLNTLGEALFALERFEEREPLYRRALDLRVKAHGEEHRLVAESLNNLASALQDLDRLDEAESMYRKAIALSEKILPPDDHEPGIWLNNLATLLSATGRHDDAEAAYRKSIRRFESSRVPNHPQFAVSLINLAAILDGSGRKAEARSLFARAFTFREKALGPLHGDTVTAALVLFRPLVEAADFAGLIPVVRVLVTTLGTPVNPIAARDLARVIATLRSALAQRRDMPELLAEYGRLFVRTLPLVSNADAPNIGELFNDVAKTAERMGNLEEAERIYREALKRCPGDAVLMGNLAFLRGFLLGDWHQADEFFRETLAHTPGDGINHTNFAGVCLARGDRHLAESHLQTARRLFGDRKDYYTARIALFSGLLARGAGASADPCLSEIKALFAAKAGFAGTSVRRLIDVLCANAEQSDRDYLVSIDLAQISPEARTQLAVDPRWVALP